ncbi:MAG TPA: UDP-3-O-acyl-N-acetylglucosamine deacetylase [Verrucomicrobiae bacterium]|nr:UDP-3-O-acyl-N-acetylglucosamine deacetylase [Verrucomicrobiae bacterium]
MAFQSTLKNKIDFTGIGLHSGAPVSMTLRPAEAGTGIVFHRVDLSPPVSIEAVARNVVNTRLSTTIGRNGATVSTIEHLMAALASFGIDNLHIDINGPEVPIMDGSAAPFVTAIGTTGLRKLSQSRKYIVVKKPVSVVEGDKKITIVPSRFFRVSFLMKFDHPALDRQFRSVNFDREDFVADYASARTFGFLHEVETLKKNGLARGGSLENAVVIGEKGVLNEEGLRYEDEFVRHKILDSVGDLYLAGYPIIGHVRATKSGHDLNHKLVTEILSRKDCWKLVDSGAVQPAAAAPFDFLPELVWSEA